MSGAGDINSRVRRPSLPGANTQVLFNAGGVEGASPNLTFNVASNTFNVFMLNVSANIANTGNLLVTQNTSTGNLSVTTLANIATLNVSVNCNVAALNVGGLSNTITLNVSSNANVSYLNVQNLINCSTLNVSVNCNVAALNVSGLANIAGSLNVAANIANTGNLLVTQNTFTGNLGVTTLANIATLNVSVNCNVAALNVGGLSNTITLNVSSNANVSYLNVQNLINCSTLNVSVNCNVAALNVSGLANIAGSMNVVGTISAIGSPVINTATRAMTGLSANLTANVTTNGNCAQTNTLSVTFNEAGMYKIEGLILLGSNNATNVANGGCNIAFGNTGTAVIATIQYAMQGRANGITIVSNLIRTTAQTAILTAGQTFSGSISANDYFVVTGYMNVSTTGTVNIAFCSANSANLSFNVMPNTYMTFTKIG